MGNCGLDDLARLTTAVWQAQEARLKRIAQAEAALRADLDRLDRQRRQAARLPAETLTDARRLGADMLWQGWAGQRRADLQTRLAQVLAQKGEALQALRQANGRHFAAARLLADSEARRRAHRLRNDTAEIQSLGLLRRAGEG